MLNPRTITQHSLLLLLATGMLLFSGCASNSHGGTTDSGDSQSRSLTQAERSRLERLYDKTGIADSVSAEGAASEVATLQKQEAEYLYSLWPTRGQEWWPPIRISSALLSIAENSNADEQTRTSLATRAQRWLGRAHRVSTSQKVEAVHVAQTRVRVLLARAALAKSDLKEAAEFAFNALDPKPLPQALASQLADVQNRILHAGS